MFALSGAVPEINQPGGVLGMKHLLDVAWLRAEQAHGRVLKTTNAADAVLSAVNGLCKQQPVR